MTGMDERLAKVAEARVLREAADIVARLTEYYPTDVFGDDLTGDEWAQVRSAGIATERIASACYRHAYRVAARRLLEAAADAAEDALDGTRP